jgi:hypothetical protein
MSEGAAGPERKDLLLFGGLAGLSAGAVVQLADKPLDGWLLAGSVICFATSLPLLSASFLIEAHRPAGRRRTLGQALFHLIGLVSAILGLGLLFFSMDKLAGFAFAGSATAAIAIVAGTVGGQH